MANEWYVQHGGKEYGPMTPANLKKLAADGKIVPTTSVRLGAAGNWVPASRVQGLFTAQANMPPAGKAAAPRPAKAVPKAPLAAPPIAPPPAPPLGNLLGNPLGNPLGQLPRASVVPLHKAVPVDGGSIAAKIFGAVGLIFGLVALATCWLPAMEKIGVIAWTGIAVGGLGLLLGIAGLVIAAQQKGSGLALGIAGTGSSAVGLVLTLVLGVAFGMFTSKPVPKPVAVAPPPIVAPPKQVAPPVTEPEPEPVWFDASSSQPIVQGDIKASIQSVGVEQLRIEDITTFKKAKPQPMLKIKVMIENTSETKIVEFPGWVGGGDLMGQGLGELVGEAGGQLARLAGSGAMLVDNVGNKYKQTPTALIFGGQITLNQDNAVRPGKSAEKELLFAPPLVNIEYLRLELPPGGFGGTDSLRFQIPKDMITGMGSLP